MVIKIGGLDVLIDDEDFERINAFNWGRLCGNKEPFYFCRHKRIKGERYLIMLHKFIVNASDNIEVDHKNGNTLDNRKENLRICSHAQNCANRKRPLTNTSGYKGVNFNCEKGKWRARIMKNRKSIFLGDFSTQEAAYSAYCEASVKYHGEFGRVI